MEPTEYARIAETLELRVIRFPIREPGRRTRENATAKEMTDAATYSREDIAELYGFRWNGQLDIRSLTRLTMSMARERYSREQVLVETHRR